MYVYIERETETCIAEGREGRKKSIEFCVNENMWLYETCLFPHGEFGDNSIVIFNGYLVLLCVAVLNLT